MRLPRITSDDSQWRPSQRGLYQSFSFPSSSASEQGFWASSGGLFRSSSRCFSTEHPKLRTFGSMPEFVKIVEVGTRDGLQNEKKIVPSHIKVELIRKLCASGLQVFELRLAQMGSTALGCQGGFACQKSPRSKFPVLTPNVKHPCCTSGFSSDAGARDVAVFAAASESFSKANINCTISESLERYKQVCDLAKQHGISVRG